MPYFVMFFLFRFVFLFYVILEYYMLTLITALLGKELARNALVHVTIKLEAITFMLSHIHPNDKLLHISWRPYFLPVYG